MRMRLPHACLAILLLAIVAAAPAPAATETQGKLAELKTRVISMEKKHRQNINRLHDALDKAREDRDTGRLQELKGDLDKERARFRKEADAIQKKLKAKVEAAGLSKMLDEKRKARKKLEATLRKLRVDLAEAKRNNDTARREALHNKMKKVEAEFVQRLGKLFDQLKAKDVDG